MRQIIKRIIIQIDLKEKKNNNNNTSKFQSDWAKNNNDNMGGYSKVNKICYFSIKMVSTRQLFKEIKMI